MTLTSRLRSWFSTCRPDRRASCTRRSSACRLTLERLEDRTAPAVVTSTADSGPGSLRQAILDANSNPGPDQITFQDLGTGPHVISLTTGLDPITEPVDIDGYSVETGAARNANSPGQGLSTQLMIELRGPGAGSGVIGLRIQANDCRVRGL